MSPASGHLCDVFIIRELVRRPHVRRQQREQQDRPDPRKTTEAAARAAI